MKQYILLILVVLPFIGLTQAVNYDFQVSLNPNSTYDLSIIQKISRDKHLVEMSKKPYPRGITAPTVCGIQGLYRY